ncbi:MAG: hypothetical protein QOE54_783 [Streptosporangiaceae bacterium]|nr:hypothetical protein [Streptosporangiaceae bacterium]MDX6428417.1 hypothetical protein [Streptosporangiaceae bacterium]
MLKKVLMTVLLAGLVFLIVQSVPDIRRYLRIRKM